jgi:parvulin-like peptidyl-prolyl isomerase
MIDYMQKHLGWILLAVVATAAQAQSTSNDVVVSRGGVTVTLQDIDTYVARVPKEHREKFIDSPARIRDMLNNLLLTKQLAEQARAAHLERQADVAVQLRSAEDEVLARARMNDFQNSVKVPEVAALAREQYVSHKDMYKVPAKVDAYQLLISTDKHSADEAKALAEQVRTEALANPKNFEALVEKYSEDNSKASNHGLMKDATSAAYVQEFRDAASALGRVGDVSPVVHTTYGYHVLQLVARTPERQQTFDEVREQLVASMREQYVANQKRDFLNQLSNEKLDINPDTLDTLRDRYDDAGNVKVAATPPAKGGGTPPATPQKP